MEPKMDVGELAELLECVAVDQIVRVENENGEVLGYVKWINQDKKSHELALVIQTE